ncbi:MAG: ribbon-helix-helix protein, CopG family [Acidobacteria bacterium]|nr:ribbon-helix-helix protein, CopG family [Acidobacteriota bacterium]
MSTQRTTVVLSLKLKQEVTAQARAQGISFGEFVRRALEKAATRSAPRGNKRSDPFWDDDAVFQGDVPSDLSKNHDLYLYGE